MGQVKVKENTLAPTEMSSVVVTKFCEKKISEEAGFVDNAMEYMDLFVHASLDEHKACFMASWNKMIERIQEVKSEVFNCRDTSSKD